MSNQFSRAAIIASAAVILSTVGLSWHARADYPRDPRTEHVSIERGRYVARIAGCNDCHTPGYAQSGGKVDEKRWLVGDQLGWQGPWGTTYPANLRMSLNKMSEEQWVHIAKNAQFRPPMPWFALRDMSESDLRSLYRFVASLGPAGEPAPAYVPPGQPAHGPAIVFPAPPQS